MNYRYVVIIALVTVPNKTLSSSQDSGNFLQNHCMCAVQAATKLPNVLLLVIAAYVGYACSEVYERPKAIWTALPRPNDKQMVVVQEHDSLATLVDMITGNTLHMLKGHLNYIYGASFNRDGTYLVTASEDRTAGIWDAQTGKLVHRLSHHQDAVIAACFNHDGTRVATCSNDQRAVIADVSTRSPTHIFRGDKKLLSTCFSPDGDKLAIGCSSGQVALCDIKGRKARLFSAHEDDVNAVLFNHSGTWMATASSDYTICIWDLRVIQNMRSKILERHLGAVNGLCFSPGPARWHERCDLI